MHPFDVPDTGSLRGDMLAFLNGFNDQRSDFTVVVSSAFAGLMASSGLTPAEVRARVLSDRAGSADRPGEVYRRAAQRGEIDLDTTPAAVLTMPFDLIRADMLMTLKPIPPERITSIVDDLFMPLVAAYRPVKA
jgi:hypothetical protein